MKIKNTAFEIIQQIMGLKSAGDNLYVSESGRKFILTEYGFWPAKVSEQCNKIKHLETINYSLTKRIKKLENFQKIHISKERSVVGQKTKRHIIRILESSLSESEKISEIFKYIQL